MEKLSFIILRHVSNLKQNLLWNECYDCIRKFYPSEKIYIIDDNSPYTPKRNGELINTVIINSEFPKQRGEVLPYYYYYTRELSVNTVILHDSVFLNSKIDPTLLCTKTAHFLWTAKHTWDHIFGQRKRTLQILAQMDNSNILIKKYNNKKSWDVCFGAMCILNIEYIRNIFNCKNYLEVLLSEIKSRNCRMCFERIIGVLLTGNKTLRSVNGDIHIDQKWNSNFTDYTKMSNKSKTMYKVWTGR